MSSKYQQVGGKKRKSGYPRSYSKEKYDVGKILGWIIVLGMLLYFCFAVLYLTSFNFLRSKYTYFRRKGISRSKGPIKISPDDTPGDVVEQINRRTTGANLFFHINETTVGPYMKTVPIILDGKTETTVEWDGRGFVAEQAKEEFRGTKGLVFGVAGCLLFIVMYIFFN